MTDMKDAPRMVAIKSVMRENDLVRTFTLDARLDAKPGQFIMLWLPGVEEKPFSLSGISGGMQITVKNVGPFTGRLFKLGKGDEAGIRGPYGNGFTLKGRRVCFVAGGVGLAPLMPLIGQAASQKKDVTVIAGFRDKKSLLFQKRLSAINADLHVVTDDGSYNRKAYATDVLKELIAQKKFDMLYSCGPELMMKLALGIAAKAGIPCQLSVERHMKCAVGICGQCGLGGFTVCRDGPVFTGEQLADTEFGKYSRNAGGARVGLGW
ncbi:MAG: dihydroorotate dehydrogenase electron transfer subunit [Candidatus Altiarchaeota archaeon]|nr:dihydroorotate dehydrogenase electron transfer subunit [Candidatus Altiarchaeota archaeon]